MNREGKGQSQKSYIQLINQHFFCHFSNKYKIRLGEIVCVVQFYPYFSVEQVDEFFMLIQPDMGKYSHFFSRKKKNSHFQIFYSLSHQNQISFLKSSFQLSIPIRRPCSGMECQTKRYIFLNEPPQSKFFTIFHLEHLCENNSDKCFFSLKMGLQESQQKL